MDLSQATQRGNQLVSKIRSQWNAVKRVTAPVNLARASASTYEASRQRSKADAKKVLSQIGPVMSQAWSLVAKVNTGQISSKLDMDDAGYWEEGQAFEDFEKQVMTYVNSREWKRLQSLARDSTITRKQQMAYHARQYHRLKAMLVGDAVNRPKW